MGIPDFQSFTALYSAHEWAKLNFFAYGRKGQQLFYNASDPQVYSISEGMDFVDYLTITDLLSLVIHIETTSKQHRVYKNNIEYTKTTCCTIKLFNERSDDFSSH